MRDVICTGSPCNGCRKNIPGRRCLYITEEGVNVNGCAAWYDWASRIWATVHRQGAETIERRDLARAEKGATNHEQAAL